MVLKHFFGFCSAVSKIVESIDQMHGSRDTEKPVLVQNDASLVQKWRFPKSPDTSSKGLRNFPKRRDPKIT